MQSFGSWLREARQGAPGRPSQQVLADRCRAREPDSAVYQARITAWELNKELPSLRQLGLMAVELELSADELAKGERLLAAASYKGLPVSVADHDSPSGPSLKEEATAT